MKTLSSVVVLTFVLACTSAIAMSEDMPLFQKTTANETDQIPDASKSPKTDEDVIIATVKSIDHKYGLVYLDSEIGQILTFATPAALQLLHEGDQVVIHVVGENPSENLAQDTIFT